jgi:PTS system nitrogen regulatory IIA component
MFQLASYLTPDLTVCQAQGTSKKRVFETASTFICERRPDLESAEVYNNLLARERLGSTTLGDGIAIPHCRLSQCKDAVVTLMTLETPVDFDAADGRPVDILFLLLVPEEATQEHLDILAGLAGLLSNEDYRNALRTAGSDEELYRRAVSQER